MIDFDRNGGSGWSEIRTGRIHPERVAGLRRNQWPDSTGISGRIPPEYAPFSLRSETRPGHWLCAALFAAHNDEQEWAWGPIPFLLAPMIERAAPDWALDPNAPPIAVGDRVFRSLEPAKADTIDRFIMRTTRFEALRKREHAGRMDALDD